MIDELAKRVAKNLGLCVQNIENDLIFETNLRHRLSHYVGVCTVFENKILDFKY
jgi:hypothetical protein